MGWRMKGCTFSLHFRCKISQIRFDDVCKTHDTSKSASKGGGVYGRVTNESNKIGTVEISRMIQIRGNGRLLGEEFGVCLGE